MKKKHLIQDTKNGGLKAIDFDCLNRTLKINRLRSKIKYIDQNHLFSKVDGLNFLITYFDVNKLPLSLSEYYKQILLYWILLHVHNFFASQHYNIE